jgi:hypothetical protein
MSNQTKFILLSLVLFTVAGCSMSQAVNKMLSPPPIQNGLILK